MLDRFISFGVFEIGPEFLISVQTGYFSGFPEPCYSIKTDWFH